MELNKFHWIGIGISIIVILSSLTLLNTKFFFLVLGIGVIIGISPFVFSVIKEGRDNAEKEEMFLEFARNLVESVKTGTPISKSIVNVRDRSYGVLSDHVKKLANQISMGIPLSKALDIFSNDVNNKTISRAVTLIGQAEKAGGDIGEILEQVAGAVSMTDRLKKERKAAISTLVVQGYIIFVVFMIIILVMQFKILPMVSGIANIGGVGNIGGVTVNAGTGDFDTAAIASSFLYLLLIQGFFSGLTIGKLSEGSVKLGLKHSFALMFLSFLSSAIANVFFG